LKVVGASKRYQPTAKFTTWLYTLAHNRLIDYYRVSARGLPISYSDDDPLDSVPGPSWQNPSRQADLRQQASRLLAAVDALPEAQREAFLMREEAGLSVEEIAEVTNVNRETAKSRLRYAVAKLRRAMESVS
jgi:RNA polymerase sigma-70 factor (ECF subfamily)